MNASLAKSYLEKTALQRLSACAHAQASRIDTTDRQIDQLVYELYGLTEAEIGIVESASK